MNDKSRIEHLLAKISEKSCGCGGGGSSGSSGDSQATTNYDKLTNRPVINVSGNPVIISQLDTGVYNIDGTWALTEDDTPKDTFLDDLFYIFNDNGVCKLTWITAGTIKTYSVDAGGAAVNITEGDVITANSLVGEF